MAVWVVVVWVVALLTWLATWCDPPFLISTLFPTTLSFFGSLVYFFWSAYRLWTLLISTSFSSTFSKLKSTLTFISSGSMGWIEWLFLSLGRSHVWSRRRSLVPCCCVWVWIRKREPFLVMGLLSIGFLPPTPTHFSLLLCIYAFWASSSFFICSFSSFFWGSTFWT